MHVFRYTYSATRIPLHVFRYTLSMDGCAFLVRVARTVDDEVLVVGFGKDFGIFGLSSCII